MRSAHWLGLWPAILAVAGLVPGFGQSSYVFAPVAGGGMPLTPAPALTAPLAAPPLLPTSFGYQYGPVSTLASDARGNLFFIASKCVWKIDLSGTLMRVAGSANPSNAYEDGIAATSASLSLPVALAVDLSGNLYIGDAEQMAVRKVTPDGRISTLTDAASQSAGGFALHAIVALAADPGGNVFISDTTQHRVFRVQPDGTLAPAAGNGKEGYTGDGGPATAATLEDPQGLAADAAGDLFIADTHNNAVREVFPDGTILTVVGGGTACPAGTPAAAAGAQTVGPSVILTPSALTLDSSGALYLVGSAPCSLPYKDSVSGVFRLSGGIISSAYVASSPGSAMPVGIAVAPGGVYYSTVDSPAALLKLPTGQASALVAAPLGSFAPASIGDQVDAPLAMFSSVGGLARDSLGNLYVTDTNANCLYQITPSLTITSLVDCAASKAAGGAYGGDGGPASAALVNTPTSIAIDKNDNVYFVDYGNYRIRRIASATSPNPGLISLVAGNGTNGNAGDGGPAGAAAIVPWKLAFGPDSSLYSTASNCTVRKIDLAGIIQTVAGNGTDCNGYTIRSAFGQVGQPATAVGLGPITSLAVDSTGLLVLAETVGGVPTVCGSCDWYFAAFLAIGKDGIIRQWGPANTSFGPVVDMAFDPTENLVFSNRFSTGNSAINPGATQYSLFRLTAAGTAIQIAATGVKNWMAEQTSPRSLPALPAANANVQLFPGKVAAGPNGVVYFSNAPVLGGGLQGAGTMVLQTLPAGAAPLWSVRITHERNFTMGESKAAFSIDVSDDALSSASAQVAVNTQPGLSLVSLTGSGWSCSANTCAQRSTPGTITAIVDVAADTPTQQTLTVSVANSSNSTRSLLGGFGSDTVTIDAACSYQLMVGGNFVSPPTGGNPPVTLPAAGGTLQIALQTGESCAWTLNGLPVWLDATVLSGEGPVQIALTGAANSGSARSAALTLGGASLTVSQPAGPMTIVSASPSSAPAGSTALLVALTGTAFQPGGGAVYTMNGVSTFLPTWYFGPTQLVASIPANLLTTAGAAQVAYWGPDSTRSTAVAFTVNAASGPAQVTPVPRVRAPMAEHVSGSRAGVAPIVCAR